jgi:hypothetical protein
MEQYELWLKALAKKREPAMAEASRLADLEQFTEAEQAVKKVDDSIYGAVALGKMYRAKLEAIVASGAAGTRDGKPRAERLFERALWWMQSAYPEPHTAMEGDNYERGRAEDLSCLVGILGYDPRPGTRR